MGRRILGVAFCLILGVVLWNGSSCYSVPQPACGFICDDTLACPAGYVCTASVCRLNGATDHCYADASIPDATDADLTPPMVLSTTPGNGETQVSRGAPISATFSQDVSGIDATTFQVFSGIAQVPGTYNYNPQSFSGFTGTFTPDSLLPAGQTINVTLTSGISNDLAVPLASYTWSFVTIDDVAPTLASSTPMNNDVNVSSSSTIVVVFSEPVENVDTNSFTVAQGVTPITGTIVASGDAITYTFTPSAALPAAATITVTLSGAITDTSANALFPVTFSFTTM